MDIELFKMFGMTEVEAKIYNALIMDQGGTLGEIALKTGIHRGTVYNSLNKLIEKGFVAYSPGENVKRYFISKKEIFLDLLKKDKELLEEKENKTKKLLEEFKLLESLPSDRPKVSITFGGKAYLEHFMSMFQLCKENKWEYFWIGDGLGNTSRLIGEDNYQKILNIKKKMKIKFRSIMNIQAKSIKHKLYAPGDRYLPKDYSFPAYTWIYGNRVVIVIFDSVPLLIITIENDKVAESYKNYFEALYSIAKP